MAPILPPRAVVNSSDLPGTRFTAGLKAGALSRDEVAQWIERPPPERKATSPILVEGARLHVIDRWYPSSKTCSGCGTVKTKLSLNTRTYVCHTCGLVMDRDLNAAINIQVAGSAPETLNARGGTARRTPGAHSPNETRTKQPHPKGVRLGANTRKSVLQAKTN